MRRCGDAVYDMIYGGVNLKNIFSADKFERWEWDNNMITYANDPDRTRVLYIGDSISVGIRNVATACCYERIIFDAFIKSEKPL